MILEDLFYVVKSFALQGPVGLGQGVKIGLDGTIPCFDLGVKVRIPLQGWGMSPQGKERGKPYSGCPVGLGKSLDKALKGLEKGKTHFIIKNKEERV